MILKKTGGKKEAWMNVERTSQRQPYTSRQKENTVQNQGRRRKKNFTSNNPKSRKKLRPPLENASKITEETEQMEKKMTWEHPSSLRKEGW